MQPLTASPRDGLTADLVTALVRDAPAVTVGHGAELVDQTLAVLADISEDVRGGSVSRAAYAELHGSAQLSISRDLDWGRAIVRPYMTLSDGQLTARFNLGAYYTAKPKRNLRETPPRFDVAGFDILLALNDPVGQTYAVDAGVGYLTAVEDILIQRGFVQYLIDRSSAALVLPAAKVWPFDPRTTWLQVVNDLLSAIGYAGIWSDWDGRPRCQPYQPPQQRPAEWTYEADGIRSMIAPEREIEQDFFRTPNRWVFYQSNNVEAAPVEGNGMYTYVNQADGPTSVEGRGRVITQPVGLDAADHASLVRQAQERIDTDIRVPTTYTTPTALNPLHWHFDRLLVLDPTAGPPMEVLGTQWTLPLMGRRMTQEWTIL
ncbi:hypothetical protein [Micromonospora tarensis]|uniref:Uncharacterized protein n=1 Tax=Micromonospora tarensis TaxID=2806100 RepID=A0ABS1YCG1_9ACTN|nr:hypothetical protein [Micromonospora tarensis]MBM0275089.1 hypothetical protein [Micromonospora tarensis]